MNYTLAVLTHGTAAPLLAAVASFAEHVTPAPTTVLIHRDGSEVPMNEVPGYMAAGAAISDAWPTAVMVAASEDKQSGFCVATRALWRRAVASNTDYVFWLEHDFVFTRDVDLRDLAYVLDADSMSLAQMQLMRGPVNEQEKAAGGLFESRRDQYEPVMSYVMQGEDTVPRPWLRHQAYMTTNPCLMRRAFMEVNPWPDYAQECEGRFGIDLVRDGYEFGVWGDGRPWVEHVGVRDGFGY